MKRFIRIIAITLLALMLSACGTHFYDLTEEETELITEYAVDVIVRHGKGTDFRLVSNAEEQLAKKRERDAAVEELKAKMREEEEEEEGETSEGEESPEDGERGGAPEVPAMPELDSISEFLGLGDVSINWMGYDVMDSYGESGGFSMDADPGNKLLVLSFYTENLTGGDVFLDILSMKPVFRVGINDGAPKVVDTTALLNDLAYFQGNLSPGAGQELVLIREIPEGEAAGIGSVSLTGEIYETEYSLGSR